VLSFFILVIVLIMIAIICDFINKKKENKDSKNFIHVCIYLTILAIVYMLLLA